MTRRYAFDIDGVLCDTRAAHKAELERELDVTLEDGGDYAHFGFRHADPAVMARLREIALDVWRRPTVCAAGEAAGQAVLTRLQAEGRLAGYVTRRHPDIYSDTFAWLSRKGFPFSANGHYALQRFPPIQRHQQLHHMLGDAESKSAHAQRLGATHLVEDSPREAWEAARDSIQVIVVRQAYNAEFEAKWQANRAELSGPDAAIWARIDFITTLEELP